MIENIRTGCEKSPVESWNRFLSPILHEVLNAGTILASGTDALIGLG